MTPTIIAGAVLVAFLGFVLYAAGQAEAKKARLLACSCGYLLDQLRRADQGTRAHAVRALHDRLPAELFATVRELEDEAATA